MEDEGKARLPQDRRVMVIGAGAAGKAAAGALLDLGVQVVLVERSPSSEADCMRRNGSALVLSGANAVAAERDGVFRIVLESAQGGCRQRSVQEADAVILATGLVPVDASLIPEFGLGKRSNVVSAQQLQDMLASGEMRRPSDGGAVSTVVFVQCVGSRVEKRGVPYCSAVCCANAIDYAIKLKERDPGIAVYILYIDIRTGKGARGDVQEGEAARRQVHPGAAGASVPGAAVREALCVRREHAAARAI